MNHSNLQIRTQRPKRTTDRTRSTECAIHHGPQQRTQPFQWVGLQLQRRLQIPGLDSTIGHNQGKLSLSNQFGAAPLHQTQQAGLGCPSTLERPFLQQGVAGLLQAERHFWLDALSTQGQHTGHGGCSSQQLGHQRQALPGAAN